MSSASIAYLLAADQKRNSSSYTQLSSSSRSSTSSQQQPHIPQPAKQSALKRAAKKVVQHAKEHHASVQQAYEVYYGIGSYASESREKTNFGAVTYSA